MHDLAAYRKVLLAGSLHIQFHRLACLQKDMPKLPLPSGAPCGVLFEHVDPLLSQGEHQP